MSKIKQLLELENECSSCKKCPLRAETKQVVFGEGNFDTPIMLVGEAPGAEEDKAGRPFVGKAGQLLDRILDACHTSKSEVYITNVVKCRPPQNRTPINNEINCCLPYLKKQIEIIDPKIIVCLGNTAARALINPNFMITRDREIAKKVNGRLVIPTFHPAALLRDPQKKILAWEDFKLVFKIAGKGELD